MELDAIDALERIKRAHIIVDLNKKNEDGTIYKELEFHKEFDAIEKALRGRIEIVVYDVYYDLCGRFLQLCREQPETAPQDIPEAVKTLNEIKEYKIFINKYFKIDIDQRYSND